MEKQRYSVTCEELKDELLRRRYIQLLENEEVFPSEQNWEFIISRCFAGLCAALYKKYIVAYMTQDEMRCDYHRLALTRFPDYVRVIDRKEALETVYEGYVAVFEPFKVIVYECNLFDAGKIGEMIDAGHPGLAVQLLDAYQPDYDGDAIDAMQYLHSKFGELPDVGCMEEHKGLFKTEERYRCPDGHLNHKELTYCKIEGCGKDIKGMTAEGWATVERLAQRIDILREMLD